MVWFQKLAGTLCSYEGFQSCIAVGVETLNTAAGHSLMPCFQGFSFWEGHCPGVQLLQLVQGHCPRSVSALRSGAVGGQRLLSVSAAQQVPHTAPNTCRGPAVSRGALGAGAAHLPCPGGFRDSQVCTAHPCHLHRSPWR